MNHVQSQFHAAFRMIRSCIWDTTNSKVTISQKSNPHTVILLQWPVNQHHQVTKFNVTPSVAFCALPHDPIAHNQASLVMAEWAPFGVIAYRGQLIKSSNDLVDSLNQVVSCALCHKSGKASHVSKQDAAKETRLVMNRSIALISWFKCLHLLQWNAIIKSMNHLWMHPIPQDFCIICDVTTFPNQSINQDYLTEVCFWA